MMTKHGSELLRGWIGNRTQEQVATWLGVQVTHLNHWLRGRRVPNLAYAVAIEDLTDGAVPVRSWVR